MSQLKEELLFDLVNRIRISQFSLYLAQHDWEQREFPNKNQLLFYNSEAQESILVAAKENFQDYALSLYNAIIILEDIHSKPRTEILTDILKINLDRLSLRVVSEISSNGTLPLLDASNIVESLKELIISTSNNEYSPRPYHYKLSRSVLEISKQFSFAQTQVGSFIFNVESAPIENIDNNTPQLKWNQDSSIGVEQTVPFSRKVMYRLNYSLQQLQEAEERDSIDHIINDGYLSGINANMCESLLHILPEYEEKATNILDIYLSPFIKQPDRNYSVSHTLKRTYEPILSAVSEKLRQEVSDYPNVILIGYVKRLSSENATLDQDNRIQISIVDGPGNMNNCYAELNAYNYSVAIEAHKNNDFLKIRGDLRKYSGRWWLENIRELELYNVTNEQIE